MRAKEGTSSWRMRLGGRLVSRHSGKWSPSLLKETGNAELRCLMGNIAPVHDGKCSFFSPFLWHQCFRVRAPRLCRFELNMIMTGQDYLGCFPHFFDGGEALKKKIVIVSILL